MRIAVFGAGGRAGRAVTAEAVLRGHEVSALVRRVPPHAGLASPSVTVTRADVTDPGEVARAAAGCAALVSAVTPASSPEALARLDASGTDYADYFANAAAALLAARPARLVVIGLFATLRTPGGGLVLDDPSAFPSSLRPYALAHLAGLRRLESGPADVDWAALTPTAGLRHEGARTGRYRLGGETVPAEDATLSYVDLAVAVLDEIESPTVHRRRASVFGAAGAPGGDIS
ncbi:NAD(P)H-binding protein [Dactylosporangium sp. NPDC000555]|uniref:NAD(P)-dependent oxidoreductase n=1 Tax=Dactylosporangium sp. NPDC000555 TaxID=3154260 RepID=UPI00331E3B7E